MIVFDKINKDKATFSISNNERINPIPILNDKYILQEELESIILAHDNSIVYEKRAVLKSEYPL